MGGPLPLEGLRVLDLASFVAGPVATTVMGDYGADVIKIEPPGDGDPQRKLGQAHSIPQHPVNFCWHLVNRNKRAMVLDLKHPDGHAVFDRLAATADVMVVNFPLKVRERLRMRYADVAALNPRLIYASMTGYGEQGPDAEQPGFDSTAFFARSGLLDALTHAGGPPAFSLPAQGDQMAGMNLFAAISMALLHRERTGEGSEVSSSLHAGGLWSNALLAQGALLGAFVAPRPPRTAPRSALANQYRTADGRWIQLTIVREDKLWPELCTAMERPDLLEDPRFQTTESRRAHATELAAILDPIFASQPWPEWRTRLRRHEITFGLLGVLRDVPEDAQAVANGAIVDSAVPEMPRTISAPIRLSFAPSPSVPGRGPNQGEHTDEILAELGYTEDEIGRLRQQGALG
ncbi:Crotonobetainyl-CoA:carnitine CoA-transferase CaiB [Enhydrobacter aerosaccus]|uniref:Crotonobetainyl-CoA:carnitine CoA-transferase CaiB n=1 Tax=Enhydrobacter aerosaccus TaxID=225324 RepID=A0A1T4TM88_9HYPH|nr:CoA transferase [Enhydrobacter aerosaccus]SKA41586.1 Crotonobetainyl-CoA:carnitine CoA-transferase CaiB [Enhydrobacter aerosaccus]